MGKEQADRLDWHVEGSRTVIMLGKKRLGYAYAPKDSPKEIHEKLDELCLRNNTWLQIWLALKAAERGDKHWHTEVKLAIKAAGEGVQP